MNKKDWVTKQDDLKAAQAIADKYFDLDEGTDTLGYLVLNLQISQPVQLRRADWVIELSEYFDATYGPELGPQVTDQVLGELFSQGNTVH